MDQLTDAGEQRNAPFYNNWGLMFVLIFIFLFNLIFSVGGALAAGIVYGISFAEARQLLSTPDGTALAINVSRLYHLISFTGYMLLPALLFTVVNRTSVNTEAGFGQRIKPAHLLMGLVLVASGLVLVNWLDQAMRAVSWPQSLQYYADRLDSGRQELTYTLLDMQEPAELLVCLLLVAAMPAFLEEFMFRGVLFNIFRGITGRIMKAVFLQALVFGILHISFYELPGIFLMGIAFGMVRAASGSITGGILMHFIFNGTAVVLHYLSQLNFKATGVSGVYDNIQISWIYGLLAALPFFYTLVWFRRQITANDADTE